VSFISPVVDPVARTIKIRVLVDNPTLALRADMYVQGGLILNKRKALLVPVAAIIREQDANYVFRITKVDMRDNQMTGVESEKVKIEINNEQKGVAAVASGLQEGDQIVGEGALLLNAALTNAEK
jgi:multidrug efflux pump subunit AcrA (membrane-fusion protein)